MSELSSDWIGALSSRTTSSSRGSPCSSRTNTAWTKQPSRSAASPTYGADRRTCRTASVCSGSAKRQHPSWPVCRARRRPTIAPSDAAGDSPLQRRTIRSRSSGDSGSQPGAVELPWRANRRNIDAPVRQLVAGIANRHALHSHRVMPSQTTSRRITHISPDEILANRVLHLVDVQSSIANMADCVISILPVSPPIDREFVSLEPVRDGSQASCATRRRDQRRFWVNTFKRRVAPTVRIANSAVVIGRRTISRPPHRIITASFVK